MKLEESFTYVDPAGNVWTVPPGAVVDGASIPKVLWSSALGTPLVGNYRRASVVHDYHCSDDSIGKAPPHNRPATSEEAARLFYYGMRADKLSKMRAALMYSAVYLFGPSWGEQSSTATPRTFRPETWSEVMARMNATVSSRAGELTAADRKWFDRLLASQGRRLVDRESAAAPFQSLDIEKITEELSRLRKQTQAYVDEPSGIAPVMLQRSEGEPIAHALVIDDDEREIFVADEVGNDLIVRWPLMFERLELNDPEDIAWDGGEWHYMTTSFRRLDEDRTRRLLRFHVHPVEWMSPSYGLRAEWRDLEDGKRAAPPVPDDSEGWRRLSECLNSMGVSLDRSDWKHKADPPNELESLWHPFALEIEGLAAIGADRLVLGFKWPLDANDHAIVLEYDWNTDLLRPLPSLDLGGLGISGLTFNRASQTLWVAANPPAKERSKPKAFSDSDREKLLGKSEVFVFRWQGDAWELVTRKPVPRPSAKLEGIALNDDRVWLTYDGKRSAMVSMSRDEFAP